MKDLQPCDFERGLPQPRPPIAANAVQSVCRILRGFVGGVGWVFEAVGVFEPGEELAQRQGKRIVNAREPMLYSATVGKPVSEVAPISIPTAE